MEIYQLTDKGDMIAANIYGSSSSARWRIIYYLKRHGPASKEQILQYAPNASGHTIYWLKTKELIEPIGRSVEV